MSWPPACSRGVAAVQDLLEAAISLGQEIWDARVEARNGGVTWLRPDLPAQSVPRPIGPYLYDGSAGIGLFYAALARVTCDDNARAKSLETLSPLRQRFTTLANDPVRADSLERLGVGGHKGVGALIWCFLHAGKLLDEPRLICEAKALTALITQARIEQDRILDVMLGSAGALLALLALHGATDGEPRLVELACACADHLLKHRVLVNGVHAWQTLPGLPPLAGFAHGAAGISYALFRLAAVVPERKHDLMAAACEGLEFEHRLFSPEVCNWRDMRRPNECHYEPTWCYGAPGIALGRLGALDVFEDARVRADIRNGLETTCSLPRAPLDDVCCGNMGRAAVLISAFRYQDNLNLRQAAAEISCDVLRRADRRGRLSWRYEGAWDHEVPLFFTGAAGVGYTLLRLVAPHELPCPLLLS